MPKTRSRTGIDLLAYALVHTRPDEATSQDHEGHARMAQWETDVHAVAMALCIHDPSQDADRFKAKCQGPKEE